MVTPTPCLFSRDPTPDGGSFTLKTSYPYVRSQFANAGAARSFVTREPAPRFPLARAAEVLCRVSGLRERAPQGGPPYSRCAEAAPRFPLARAAKVLRSHMASAGRGQCGSAGAGGAADHLPFPAVDYDHASYGRLLHSALRQQRPFSSSLSARERGPPHPRWAAGLQKSHAPRFPLARAAEVLRSHMPQRAIGFPIDLVARTAKRGVSSPSAPRFPLARAAKVLRSHMPTGWLQCGSASWTFAALQIDLVARTSTPEGSLVAREPAYGLRSQAPPQ